MGNYTGGAETDRQQPLPPQSISFSQAFDTYAGYTPPPPTPPVPPVSSGGGKEGGYSVADMHDLGYKPDMTNFFHQAEYARGAPTNNLNFQAEQDFRKEEPVKPFIQPYKSDDMALSGNSNPTPKTLPVVRFHSGAPEGSFHASLMELREQVDRRVELNFNKESTASPAAAIKSYLSLPHTHESVSLALPNGTPAIVELSHTDRGKQQLIVPPGAVTYSNSVPVSGFWNFLKVQR